MWYETRWAITSASVSDVKSAPTSLRRRLRKR
jgi:hypothetical protein